MLKLWGKSENARMWLIVVLLLFMQAISHGQNLKELRQELNEETDPYSKTDLLLSIVAQELAQGNTDAAMDAVKRASMLADSLNAPELLGQSLLGQGRVYAADKKYEDAVQSYFEAINLISKYNKERLWVVYQELGSLYQRWKGYEKSAEYYHRSLESLPENHKKEEAEISKQLVLANLKLDRYAEAISLLQGLLVLYDEVYMKEEKRWAYYQLALTHENDGQYEEAIAYAKDYLESSKEIEIDQIQALNTLGFLSRKMKRGKDAKEYFTKALNLNEKLQLEKEEHLEASLLTNSGVIYANLRDYNKALEAFEEAVEIRKIEGNYLEEAKLYNHIATTYLLRGDLIQAKSIAKQAVHISEKAHTPQTMQNAYQILANISEATGEFEDYQNYNSLYQREKEKILERQNEKEQEIVNRKFIIEQLESRLKLTSSEARQQQLAAENAEKEKELAQARAEQAEQKQRLEKARAEQAVKDRQLARAKAEQAVQARLLAEQRAENERKEKELANVRAAEALVKAQKADQARELIEAKADKERVRQQQELREQQQDAQFKILLAILLFVIFTLGLITIFFFRNKKKNRLLATQNEKIIEQNDDLQSKNTEISAQRDKLSILNKDLNQKSEEISAQRDAIESEKEKSDQLLLNILPWQTAKELKEHGKATPREYELATVLFTDFRGFTQLAEKLTPEEVIEELNYCFSAFDEIMSRNNLEKIKTIGDAYMAVGGVPIANETNPIDAVRAGLEIQEFATKWASEKKAKGLPSWEVRLGIHTGSLIAGVVGTSKFAFDIWGDAVNLAARMESSGEVGRVNISETTYELVKDYFQCEYRGKVNAKNKGEVDMYFVNPTI